MLKSFRTYQLAKEFYSCCEVISAPSHIRDQLLRASLSIVLNLAEGCGKNSVKDRIRFYGIAMGSFRETQAILEILNQACLLEQSDKLAAHLYKLTHFSGP